MSEDKIYEMLNNISLLDIFSIVIKRNNIKSDMNNIDIYYTAKDLYKLYPNIFSKYKLNKYIKEENLPVIKKGKSRLFKKEDIEEWLKQKNELQIHFIRR